MGEVWEGCWTRLQLLRQQPLLSCLIMEAEAFPLIDGPDAATASVLLAHGAGAPMDSPFMAAIAGSLVLQGWRIVRFEFPYMARLPGVNYVGGRVNYVGGFRPVLPLPWQGEATAKTEPPQATRHMAHLAPVLCH